LGLFRIVADVGPGPRGGGLGSETGAGASPPGEIGFVSQKVQVVSFVPGSAELGLFRKSYQQGFKAVELLDGVAVRHGITPPL
jgi:hypothetical protein